MAKSTTPQTEVLPFSVPLSLENLVCSLTLVVSKNKSQDFGAYLVEKPLDEHVYEETKAGSMAVSLTMLERLFEGDLPEETSPVSCILNVGAELVAVQSLASLRGVDQLTLIDQEMRSPDQVPYRSDLVFDQTPMGTDFEDNEEEEEEPQLRWRQRGMRGVKSTQVDGSRQETPDIADRETSPVCRADSGEERQRKGKGKLVKAHGTRKPTSTPVNADDSDTQSENIIRYVIKCKREAEEERVNSKKSHKRAKKSIAKKGKNIKKKIAQPGSPEVEESSERFKEQQPVKGPGPRGRNQKAVKELTREERVEIMETQKVLSGRVFDPKIATKFGMVALVDVVSIQE
ncbi:hypothetical protein H5410_023704 [Solanum commersonii]|uniref:Uncharacterized protein n=1 Tax=Solanum commersonii TaxID=4109 RepID=A0A9J5ZJE0_SOLCO|nr:hypothetical protein H5410_023704 [Solanum commersonii]